MRVFVTGATGFIGTVVVRELLQAGHQVLGLARSEKSAKKLMEAGVMVHHGDLEDLDSLTRGAEEADGVIHAGFIHDFTRFKVVCEVDKKAIEQLGEVLRGTNRPLIVTAGTAMLNPGKLVTENMKAPFNPAWPRVSEPAAEDVCALGTKAAVLRLSPSVHGEGDKGFIQILINIAREKGMSAYIGEGLNRWSAVHRLDAALLFRLALENAEPGARYHGVAEESVTLKSIAEAIGKQLHLPAVSISSEAAELHFGWFSHMVGMDCPASSKLTKEGLDWHPTHSKVLEDINNGIYTRLKV